MEKTIKSLFSKKPDWLNRQIVLLFSTLLIFIIAMLLSEPLPHATAMQINHQDPANELVSIPNNAQKLNLKDICEDCQFDSQQTDSVIFGGVILLCIIIGGVLTVLRQQNQMDMDEIVQDKE